jgi:hypothetical protein
MDLDHEHDSSETSATTAEKCPKISVVLNGGKNTMDSATIPFQIYLDDKAIQAQPTHVLVIVQNEREANDSSEYNSGERKIVPLNQGVGFIQFTSPGYHRIAFIALHHKGNPEGLKKYCSAMLTQEAWNRYKYAICWSYIEFAAEGDIRQLTQTTHHCVRTGWPAVAACIAEVEVSKEFFATTKTNGPLWRWVNRWHKIPPRDQCEFRKRAICAFTLQPIVVALRYMLQYPIGALLLSVYLPTARVVIFLFGFRPEPLFKSVGTFWHPNWGIDRTDWDLRQFGDESYRVWECDTSRPAGKMITYMPITMFEIGLMAAASFLVLRLGQALWHIAHGIREKNWALMTVGTIVVFLVLWGLFESRLEKVFGFKRRATGREEHTTLLYHEWLRAHLHVSKQPNSVDLEKVPQAFKGRLVQRLTVAFWAAKIKVCKPFARR